MVSDHVRAYVEGMQGSATGLLPSGVATVVKHWVGYGAAVDGFDGHNYYGRFARFPSGKFDQHVAAFDGMRLTPHFAKTAVNPAKKADAKA